MGNDTGQDRLSRQQRSIRMETIAVNRPVILIVEDDFLIRMGAVEMIEAAGFAIVEAANADEAMVILEVRLDVTVAFTDIQMPGSMDGLKLAAAIRGRWPPIKIVATSGRVNVRTNDLPEGGLFLPKPYNSAEIVRTLREVTGAEPRASSR
jgi:two-component system, response regulator PdtaR